MSKEWATRRDLGVVPGKDFLEAGHEFKLRIVAVNVPAIGWLSGD